MIPSDVLTFLLSIGGIILIDVILSGDNALVIGAAASRIQQRKRRWLALAIGGLFAMLLRIVFTISTTLLLEIPYLQATGGLLILVIAIRLLYESQPDPSTGEPGTEHTQDQLPALLRRFSGWANNRKKQTSSEKQDFLMALLTITVADITMSLDNIIAVSALAHHQPVAVAIGLVLSIGLLILGSALVSELISHIPWLIIIASFILAWVAADLIWNDLQHLPFVQDSADLLHVVLLVLCFSAILVFTLVTRRQQFRAATGSSS